MIVYNNKNGDIMAIIPDDQKPRDYRHISQDDISTLLLVEYPEDNIRNYFIRDDKLTRYSEQEILELQQYGKILTEEERLNILLQPTGEEVTKAESTLEILSTLQEVGLI